jgi:type II secretory pathway component PulJ
MRALFFRTRRGYSLIEAVVTLVILSFVVAATATMMEVGTRQQRLGRNYSEVQTELRDALRRVTRGLRHGYQVVASSTQANFATAPTSGPTQVIVKLPQAGGGIIEVRYHLSNGTLYSQREDETAPGTARLTEVDSLSLSYYQTVGSVRSAADSSPGDATEIRFYVTATRGSATTPVEALVALRNRLAGTP